MSQVRRAILSDAPYIKRAAEEFCAQAGIDFDAETFHDTLFNWLTRDCYRLWVIPGKAHCGAIILPCMYSGKPEARVITIWGEGGIKCFRHAVKELRAEGIDKIYAGVFLEPRIAKVYERMGLTLTEKVYS